jgi:hypothetical protein
MKMGAGWLLVSVCSLLVTGTLLQGCGSKADAPPAGMAAPADASAPAAPRFTIVGAGK